MTAPWLTPAEAAKRVDRSERTIARWIEAGAVKVILGRIAENQLLQADRVMRERRAHAGERVVRESAALTALLQRARLELADRIRAVDPYGNLQWKVEVVDGPREQEVRLVATPSPRP